MSRLFSIRFSTRVPLIVLFFIAISLSLPVSSQNVGEKICQTEECLAAAKNLRESMNLKADPCNDFYKYACGKWLRLGDQGKFGGPILSRYLENLGEIIEFLQKNNSNDEPEAVHKARNFFSLCQNKAAYNSKLEQIETILQKIGLPVLPFITNETKKYDYSTLLARAIRLANTREYFSLEVYSDFYNGTLNTIALSKGNPPQEKKLSSESKTAIFQKTQLYCKDHPSDFCTQWKTQKEFEKNVMSNEILNRRIEIAEIVEKPRYALNSSVVDVYTLKQLQDLTDNIAAEVNAKIPTLNWTRYIEEIFSGVDNVTLDLRDPNKVSITIAELDAVKEMIQLIHKSENTNIIEFELWWEVVFKLIPNVFPSNGEVFGCAATTQRIFGMAVSYVYATKNKYIKAKAEIPTLFKHVHGSFQQIINQTSWMDEITRQRALKKLQSLTANIAYPSKIKSTPSFLNNIYEDVNLTDNFFETWISIIQNRITKNLKKLNQINDDPRKVDEWTETPDIVNAEYQHQINSIYILSGFLGTPMYYNGLNALDYGAIGYIIGHEMGHGFDNTGRRFNEVGNIQNWWEPETESRYREKAKCFKQAYGNYSATSHGVTLMGDSKLTLGEDLSDNVGFKVALFAYRKCVSVSGEEPLLPQFENFTHEQLLTLGFANVWCENPALYDPQEVKLEVHSPNAIRVNGVLRNSKEFSEIWKCSKGSNMNPSDDKCTLW